LPSGGRAAAALREFTSSLEVWTVGLEMVTGGCREVAKDIDTD
jgi:hypothetical protein